MPEHPPPSWMKYASIFILFSSIAMLILLVIYVPLSCGQVSRITGGESVCELGTGWYIFTGAFVLLLLYSVYNLNHFFYGWNWINFGSK